ncbi:HNH endonuclease [Rhizobium deserti]|uniref:HNH endonuclease n=1 Tax=Rhizobium deserti TaxID=2547961 RepID=A0A4V3APK1_9HYPH|nr:HNH endonuclease [Rhizobium deserti]TDK37125.1 HNH endonuclease [Rhizobium deserti]
MTRKPRYDVVSWYEQPEPEICPLCGRDIPQDQRDEHHLVPKSRGGRQTQSLHRICHRQIHALFSEAEIEKSFPTMDALLEHPEIRKFAAWVAKKPPGFYDGTKRSNRRR